MKHSYIVLFCTILLYTSVIYSMQSATSAGTSEKLIISNTGIITYIGTLADKKILTNTDQKILGAIIAQVEKSSPNNKVDVNWITMVQEVIQLFQSAENVLSKEFEQKFAWKCKELVLYTTALTRITA